MPEGYEKGRRTVRHLVETGSELFAERGYEGCSVEQVARAAGLTKGAVYAHFRGKRDLYLACLEHSLDFFREPVVVDPAATGEERLRTHLTWLGGRLAEEPTARAFFVQIVREPEDDEATGRLILRLLAGPYAQLRDAISVANPGADAGALAFFVFSALLLDPELHRFHVLMSDDGAPSHSLATTVDHLVAAVGRA